MDVTPREKDSSVPRRGGKRGERTNDNSFIESSNPQAKRGGGGKKKKDKKKQATVQKAKRPF